MKLNREKSISIKAAHSMFILLVSGIILLGITFYLANKTWNFIQSSEKTSGIVVGMKHSRSGGNDSKRSSYTPIIRYTDLNNNSYEFDSKVSTSSPRYKEGEEVQILYHKDQPEQAEINTFLSLWTGEMIFGFLGLSTFLIGLSMLLKSNKINREQQSSIEYRKRTL